MARVGRFDVKDKAADPVHVSEGAAGNSLSIFQTFSYLGGVKFPKSDM